MRRAALAIAGLAALAGAAPAAAAPGPTFAGACASGSPIPGWGPTRIVLGKSIGRLAVGDERGCLRAVGLIDREVARTPNPEFPGGGPNFDRVLIAYDALRVLMRFQTDEESASADRVLTFEPAYRTAKGIGVGSTRAAVRASYPGAVCFPTLCRVGVAAPGRVVTRFHLKLNRVFKVHLVTLPPSS